MIKNFEKTPSNFIYDLQYEKFVSDPENEAKKLMKLCGLPWDIKCLEFYNTERSVKTASDTQIRNKIYKSSIDSWKNFEVYMRDFFNNLTD